jgi:uncharacterized protein (TIGR04141 family)
MRSRIQSSAETTFENFGVDQLRDVVDAATGRPHDTNAWGHRVTGADGLNFSLEGDVHQIAEVCRRVEAAHSQDDYRARFSWIDDVQPVNDPDLVRKLTATVIEQIRSDSLDELELAPPEIVNWEQVAVFRFHTDGHQNTKHRQLRLGDYRRSLDRTDQLEDLNLPRLRHGVIKALDGNGDAIHQWPVWNAVVGTIQHGGSTYILENGEFFTVAPDFLAGLDEFIDRLPVGATALPACALGLHEKDYNRTAAETTASLLLDRDTIIVPGKTTAIEISDLLTTGRELVHVKREFGSRDLSHLFSQGTTSAELIHDDEAFRGQVQKKVTELSGDNSFAFFDEKGIVPSSFTVTFAVIGDWKSQTVAERLSFFSKVNLRRAVTDLRRRGYQVAFQPVDQLMQGR